MDIHKYYVNAIGVSELYDTLREEQGKSTASILDESDIDWAVSKAELAYKLIQENGLKDFYISVDGGKMPNSYRGSAESTKLFCRVSNTGVATFSISRSYANKYPHGCDKTYTAQTNVDDSGLTLEEKKVLVYKGLLKSVKHKLITL